MRLVRGGLGYAPTIVPIAVSSVWVGNVSASAATVKARSLDATATTLRYSTSPDLSGFLTSAGTEGSDDVWSFTLTGLSDSTTYYFGFTGSVVTGRFTTFPSGAASFLIAASGDSGAAGGDYDSGGVSDPPTYARIAEHSPLLFIHLGDLHYRNLNTTNVASYRTAYNDVLAASTFNDFLLQVPTAYMWDDHDFGPDDADGTYTGKSAARQAYTDHVPHWSLPGNGIEQTFVIGRVRFILLDPRYERTPNGATDNSSKTRLGATQKQWLKDTLDGSTEPCVVLHVGSWIGGTTGFADGWDSFSTERTELFDFFEANGHMDRLYLIGADIHELMDDDGTNTNYATTPSGDGPPYAGFAPIDASFNDFSADPLNKYQTRRQQYGTMEFTDDGSQITVTVKGWALSASPGSTASEVFSRSKVFSG